MNKVSRIPQLLLCSAFLTLTWANNINWGGHKGLIRVMSTETYGTMGLNIGGAIKYDFDKYYAMGPPEKRSQVLDLENNRWLDRETAQLFSGDVFFVYGIYKNWDMSIDLPVYRDKTGWETDHTALGNLEIATKLSYPVNQEAHVINQAYYLKMVLPTGSKGGGYFPRHAYYIKDNEIPPDRYTTVNWVLNPMMIWTIHFDRLNKNFPLKLHANLGGAIHSTGTTIAGVGLEYQPTEWLSLFLETSGESRISHYMDEFSLRSFDNDIFLITPGIRFTFENGLYITLAYDYSIADSDILSEWELKGNAFSTKGSPEHGFQITMGWAGLQKEKDSDKDGILNMHDRCPMDPEDRDNYQDMDGCPDRDNDNDGVLDDNDKCPITAALCDGCPPEDVDKDGITTAKDRCPEEPEDKDNFEDQDGCPDIDNDKDNIYDKSDHCPNQAEDTDGFEDKDGCPDLDNDGDGILDAEDDCPNEKGQKEKMGCPKTKEIQKGELILLKVSFQMGSAELTANSFLILDQVVESLLEYPEVKLEIQGHTDNVGDKEKNLRLSQRRAETVSHYLNSKGVAPSRLKAVGYGESVPITDNDTAAGREQNRRVELKRID
jgi:outer membrane protein OmpA-like peptidoglycan-associated protein